jgi:hypothetical protein
MVRAMSVTHFLNKPVFSLPSLQKLLNLQHFFQAFVADL